jgi:hypothetical protein
LDTAVVAEESALVRLANIASEAYTPDLQEAYETAAVQDPGRNSGTDQDEDDENCTTHLQKTKAQRGTSGIVCFRAPKGATQDQIDELKDHIAALNAIPNYWSPKGRVSPRNEDVVGPDGTIATLEDVAEKIKNQHKDEVKGTPYEYNGKVAGHLPDTTWSGKQSPYCWHPQDTDVNSKVGRWALKYQVGYKPTGFYYAGVDGDPGTYTTERVAGSVAKGRYGICSINRP